MHPVVTAAWLEDALDEESVRIVDCRYSLADPAAGRRAYEAGHLPGAVFLDLAEDLSAPPGGVDGGRHPLPSPERFQAAVRRAGVGVDTTVVAYDDDGRQGGAARLWWLLRHHGHPQVAVLEGGMASWDGPIERGEPEVPPGDFTIASTPRDDVVDAETILGALDRGARVLLDARAPERFRGQVEPYDAVAGHIPGARNAPAIDPSAVDEALLEDSRELVAYCGSGVTATVVLLDLAARGRGDGKLYPGSWSEWSARGLPVETGS